MKKLKILTPVLGISILSTGFLPVISCSKTASNVREIELEQGYKDIINITNTPYKNGDLVINLIPKDDKIQVENINKILLGSYELKSNEFNFIKKSGSIVITKNILDAHGGSLKIELQVSQKKPVLKDLSITSATPENPIKYFEGDVVKANQFVVSAVRKYSEEAEIIKPSIDGKKGYTVYDYDAKEDITSKFANEGIVLTNKEVERSEKLLYIKYCEEDEYGETITIEKTLQILVADHINIDSSQMRTIFDVGEEFLDRGIIATAVYKDEKISSPIRIPQSSLKYTIKAEGEEERELIPKDKRVEGTRFVAGEYGEQYINVYYNGHKSSYKVNILDERDHAVVATNNAEEEGAISTVTVTQNSKGEYPDIWYNKNLEAKDEWVNIGKDATTHEVKIGPNESILLKGKNDEGLVGAKITFKNDDANKKAQINLKGESASLINGATRKSHSITENCFENLFEGSDALVSVSEDFISSPDVLKGCYKGMFKDCINLTKAPNLHAKGLLRESCYESMFEGCESLTSVPNLPTEVELNDSCYKAMFKGCKNLKNTPEFTNVQAGNSCFESMFENCTSLEITPKLPIVELAKASYKAMFKGCTNLKSIGYISAGSVKSESCAEMFSGCTNLSIYAGVVTGGTPFFVCPSYGAEIENPFLNMFYETKIKTTSPTPTPNTKYYFKI